MSEQLQHLHLLNAAGPVRSEMYDGRDHFVVPVVALMEGVIHAVNAETPEFVPLSTLERAAATWNGRPVTLGHPARDGKQCSANSPDILASHGIGVIRNSRVEGRKLLQEALIDKAKIKALSKETYDRLAAGKTDEVSVGAFVVADTVTGEYNSKQYKGSWLGATGDHLAFLPGGRGACSCDMGCGTHRAATAHFVTAEAFEPMLTQALLTLEGMPLDERLQAVHMAVGEKWKQEITETVSTAYALQVYDDKVIVRVPEDDEVYSVSYTVSKDGKVSLGEATKVKQAWVAAAAAKKMKDCPSCNGTGSTSGNPCETCDGTGELQVGNRAAAISPPPAGKEDSKSPAAIMPQPRAAGCGCKSTTSSCGCHGEHRMAKTRAEQIAELVTDPHSGFKVGDEATLETCSDSRLEEFRAASAARATEQTAARNTATELTKANARLVVAEERLRVAQESPSEQDWLDKAPPKIKALVDAHKAQEDATKASLVAQLKDCGSNTEAELKAMDLDMLKQLASYARVEVPDYSGRGLPQERNASDKVSYIPPNPYADGIKALQAKTN